MVKISDVARHAGVSPSTVSYVLSGKRAISEQTRRRVLESIRVLGYHPHAGARALASNRSNVLALVVPLRAGRPDPVLTQFAVSVVMTARTYDHDVLLLTQDEGVAGLERVAGASLVDAIIVMDIELHDARLPVLRSLARPSVLIGFPADSTGLTCVDLDFEAVGAACAEHLADLGHREVALVGAAPAVYRRGTGFAERTKTGFEKAAARRGLTASVCPCEPETAGATAAALLRDRPGLTGVAVHNESAVRSLIEGFRVAGRRVPDDLSVLAVAPDDLAESTGLTSIAVPVEELGREAVELLIGKLEGQEVPGATLLPPRLTDRSSTSTPCSGRAEGPSTSTYS